MKTVLFILLSFNLYAYTQTSDAHNTYLQSEHFRAIIGKSQTDIELLNKYLDIAENVWQKEILDLEFITPKNSQTKLIDIYIGNTSAYNSQTQSDTTISSSYAGYALEYPSDNTPYFIINPLIQDDILKVTIAHEFFHTLQYNYIKIDEIPYNEWITNIWWLEATAVLMEDEVYNNINDYFNYLYIFFDASYKDIETYDGLHEYSMVIFAKYLKKKYGLSIIKNSFFAFNSAEDQNFFSILDKLLQKNHNTTMEKSLQEFAQWVNSPELYFADGAFYPALNHFSPSTFHPLQKGGIEVINNITNGWNMVTLSTNKNDVDAIWGYKNGIWSNNLTAPLTNMETKYGYWVKAQSNKVAYYNYFDTANNDLFALDSQWHLFGALQKIDTNSLNLASKILLWQYSNGKWSAYSNNSEMLELLKNQNFPLLKTIFASTAYWVKKL